MGEIRNMREIHTRFHGWRYAVSDHSWHCFTEGEARSLCGAHELGRHGATADRLDIPKETRCVFCEAAWNRERALIDAVLNPTS